MMERVAVPDWSVDTWTRSGMFDEVFTVGTSVQIGVVKTSCNNIVLIEVVILWTLILVRRPFMVVVIIWNIIYKKQDSHVNLSS